MVTNHVYTIAGAKGGVGKTTSSINLGTLLAEAGYSTVVVEMDLAMANLVDFLDVDVDTDEDATFHDVLAGNASVTDAMYETEVDLSIVPSGTTLEGYADTDLDRLPDIVETLRWHHDVVLLDTPAGLSEETVRPLQLADDVLLISTPRVASIRNVSNTKELAERVDAPVRGLVLTKSGTGASPGADEIAEFLDVELLGHVPEDDAVPHAQDNGTPVVQNAPRSGAAIAYERIARQLVDTEKASTDSTAGATPIVSDDTVPTHRQVERPAEAESAEAGTTDGGQEVHTPDTVADDSDLIGPVRPEQDGVADPDDDAESTEAGESSVPEGQTADAEDEVESESIIDGETLVDTGPVAESEGDGDESEPAAETVQSESEALRDTDEPQSDTEDPQEADESQSVTDDPQDADQSESDGEDQQETDEPQSDSDDEQDADEEQAADP
ncbi:MAG: cell division ATPase MinD, partial [Haloarcula sp.]